MQLKVRELLALQRSMLQAATPARYSPNRKRTTLSRDHGADGRFLPGRATHQSECPIGHGDSFESWVCTFDHRDGGNLSSSLCLSPWPFGLTLDSANTPGEHGLAVSTPPGRADHAPPSLRLRIPEQARRWQVADDPHAGARVGQARARFVRERDRHHEGRASIIEAIPLAVGKQPLTSTPNASGSGKPSGARRWPLMP